MADIEVVFPGGKRVDALFKGFLVQTDQPESSGGNNSAPSPFDLFLSSIATCAGIFVLGFCQSRDIPTEGMKLLVDLTRNEETHLVEKIRIKISLPSEFPAKYTQAVIRAAELCSVKKHLHNPPAFEIVTEISG